MSDSRSQAVAETAAWRSGPWRIDVATRTLSRDGAEIAVPPKAMACLLHLVANHQRAVSRDELIDAVWGHAHLSDGVLAQTIFQLRGILAGGVAEGPIRSLRGFGYRWVEPVVPEARPNLLDRVDGDAVVAMQPADPDIGGDRASPAGSSKRWNAVIVGVLAIALLAPLLVWWLGSPLPAAKEAPPTPDSDSTRGALLVLPVDAGDDPEHTWMRLGLMDLIASRLRAAGVTTVPVETAVLLGGANHGKANAPQGSGLWATTGSAHVLNSRVGHAGGVWVVAVDAMPATGQPIRVLAEAPDAIAAAREAADRLALALGHAPAPLPAEDAGLLGVLQQVDAALLARDLDRAGALINDAGIQSQAHPRLRMAAAVIAFHRLDLPRARDLFESLRATLDPATHPRLAAQAQTSLASVHALLGQPARTRELLEALIPRLEGGPDGDLLGVVQMNLGLLAQERGELAAADLHLARARHLLEGVGDLQRQSVLASNLGVHALRSERLQEAVSELDRAHAGFLVLGDPAGCLHVLAALLETHLARFDLPAADAIARRIEATAVRDVHRLARAYADTTLAMLALEHGQLVRARQVMARLDEAANAHAGMAPYKAVLALLRMRDLDAQGANAADLSDQATKAEQLLAGHPNLVTYRAEAWQVQLRAAVAMGDQSQARQLVAALTRWAHDVDGVAPRLHSRLAQALLAQSDADQAAALAIHAEAWTLLEGSDVPGHWLLFAETALPWLGGQDGQEERLLHLAHRLALAAPHHFGAARARARILATVGPEAGRQAALRQLQRLAGERVLPADLRTVTQVPLARHPAVAGSPD